MTLFASRRTGKYRIGVAFVTVCMVGSMLSSVVLALGIDTSSPYAWGENIGWLNWGSSEGAVTVPLEGGGDFTGYVWGENIGWLSLNCSNTSSCPTVDYKTSRIAAGQIRGYAWGENVGWISFSCENTSSCGTVSYGVSLSESTREFSGYAWGENIGWISMNCSNTSSCGTVSYMVKAEATPVPGGVVPIPGPGASGSPTPTPMPSGSPTPSVVPTGSPTPTPTRTPSPLPSPFPTPGQPPTTSGPTTPPVIGGPSSVPEVINQVTRFIERLLEAIFDLIMAILRAIAELLPDWIKKICPGVLGAATCTVTAATTIAALAAVLAHAGLLAFFHWMPHIVGLKRKPHSTHHGALSEFVEHALSIGFWIGLFLVPLHYYLVPSKTNLLILILFFAANAGRIFSRAEPYGVIRDAVTGKPLPHAAITIEDPATGVPRGSAISDEQGRFTLPADQGKEYDLVVRTPASVIPARTSKVRISAVSRASKRGWITLQLTI